MSTNVSSRCICWWVNNALCKGLLDQWGFSEKSKTKKNVPLNDNSNSNKDEESDKELKKKHPKKATKSMQT